MLACQKLVVRALRLRRNTHWQDYASFDSLLARAGLGHLVKGWIVCGTPAIEDCLTGLTGSSTRAGADCTDLQLQHIGNSVLTVKH